MLFRADSDVSYNLHPGIAQPVLHRFAAGERDLTLTTADKLIEYFGLALVRRKA